MLIHLITHFSLVITIVHGQLVSPCPEILSYEPRKSTDEDRWYATVSLTTVEDLEGIWLKIELDRKADILGNWFGETTTNDNTVYSIRNPSYRLEAGPPVTVRFFVKYNPANVIPTVKKILLNGKTICPSKQGSTVTQPTLHLSKPKVTSTSRPHTTSSSTTSNPSIDFTEENTLGPRQGLSATSAAPAKEDEFFKGDFYLASTQKPPSKPLLQPSSQPAKCGTVAQRPNPLITKGQNTTPGQWPWHAALYHSQRNQLTYTCGGTLISPKHVLTAAHCVTRPRTNNPINERVLVVYLGKYQLVSFGNEVQDRDVDQIIVHPEYNNSMYYNDIAILLLSSAVEITDYVRVCCLWDDDKTDLEKVVGKQGTVIGWGFDENKELSKNLMQAQMPVVSTTTCIFSNRNFFSQFIFDKNFCAGFKNGTSVCNGDSGGGMVFPKPGTSGQNRIWQVRGVVSVGVALQGEGVCDPNQYVVFTDVAKYLDWIKDIIKS